MEKIIEKLNQTSNEENLYGCDWSLEEMKKLLDIYLALSRKESDIFDLIYRWHGCDSWEDIFRDYSYRYLEDKAEGVEVAIEEITEALKMEQIEKEREELNKKSTDTDK